MFTGIIEQRGRITSINNEGPLIHIGIESEFTSELKVDQSVAHDGVCLTVTKLEGSVYFVTAVQETLDKSNLQTWQVGGVVNLERCMLANGRFDGHIVQGHVDCVGTVVEVIKSKGNVTLMFSYLEEFEPLIVEKGSICINGTSLTAFNVGEGKFSVTIIPYTWENTSANRLEVGSVVNLEFDILGKYINKMHSSR